MNTQTFENEFRILLGQLIKDQHPMLQLNIPASGSFSEAPSPDFIVSNPTNGNVLMFELKTGDQARQIPISTIPSLSALKATLPTQNSQIVFVSSGSVPSFMVERLNTDGIDYRKVETIQDVQPWLNEKLSSFESR